MTETELEYQFCFNCNDRKNCYTKPKDCTRIKEEIGLQDMTNEEWRKTCSAEEFAEWMAQYYCDVNTSDVREILKNEWLAWLKQPHTNE